MSRLVEKKELLSDELQTYIDNNLSDWKLVKKSTVCKDVVYEKGKSVCFISQFGKGFLVQKLED